MIRAHYKVCISLLIVVVMCSSSRAEAISDSVIISQSVTNTDITAPTVPSNVVATALATDQITLTWSASSDNVGVSGYQVFREGVQIATTTLLSYADTGLSEGTTYEYYVTAFDAVLNVSASSTSVSATTLSTSVSTTTVSGGGSSQYGSLLPLRITNLKVVTELSGAYISWETNIPTKSRVSWGMTEEYEMGTLAERALSRTHRTHITELLPGTIYRFQIVGQDEFHREVILATDSFQTLLPEDTIAPPNVRFLRGILEGTDAVLSWQNPNVPDFAKVRIVRKVGGYPADPNDGVLIFEGDATTYRDQGIFNSENAVHYAVFAYDQKGNGASGAVVHIYREGSEEEEDVSPTEGAPVLSFDDLIFLEGNRVIPYIGTDVVLKGNAPFTVRVPYGRLPEHLKTIVVTLADASQNENTFSFLLRVNKEKTAYEAVIDTLEQKGTYPFRLAVLDYTSRTISKIQGNLIVAEAIAQDDISPSASHIVSSSFLRNIWTYIGTVSLIFLALILIILARRRRKIAKT